MKKVEFDHRTNLIEQSIYKYNLQEIAEPNLFREIFPYTEIPNKSFIKKYFYFP